MEILNLVQAALKYIPENELLRPGDRPYDSGYFLDTRANFNNAAIQAGMGVTMELEYAL